MIDEQIAREKTLAYFNGDEIATAVWLGKYALRDGDGVLLEETPTDMHRRLAKEFARIEAKYPNPMSEGEIFELLDGFKYVVPQGSPMSGIGNDYKIQSLSNCFVIPSPLDSYAGILYTDQQQVQIMKRRGGVGFDISNIRPRGMLTNNAAGTTDGISIFLERFSNSCREVAQSGRRGALMLTIDCRHPEIETFIGIKKDLTKVTGANISIRVTDGFMHAVKTDSEFTLQWPVDSDSPSVSRTVKAKEIWQQMMEAAHGMAEPGILFWDSVIDNSPADCYADQGYKSISTNPCQPEFAEVLTPAGVRTFSDIDVGSTIWSGMQWAMVSKKVYTGVKPVYAYETNAGTFVGTEEHKVFQKGVRIEAKNAKVIDVSTGPRIKLEVDSQHVVDGWVVGDGTVHRASGDLVLLCLGGKDGDFLTHKETKWSIKKPRFGISPYMYEVTTDVTAEELPLTFNREIPNRYLKASPDKVASFLRGIYSANGSLCGGRITLKAASKVLIRQVQSMLSSLGIRAYITTNKAKKVKFDNGEYQCKESYALNITSDRHTFRDLVGFVQKYKADKLDAYCDIPTSKGKTSYPIVSKVYLGDLPVWDITVDVPEHSYWTGGLLVSNCAELVLSAHDSCRLIALNTSSYVKAPFSDSASFDFDLWRSHVVKAQRLMDDLVDLELEKIDQIISKIKADPEPESVKQIELDLWVKIRVACVGGRRTGLGITALGDAIAALGMRYGSGESIAFVESVYKTLAIHANASSVTMAEERGAFPAWHENPTAYRGNAYMERLIEASNEVDTTIADRLWKTGRRNIALLTTAPTGSLSCLTQTTSGIEPVFRVSYKRRKKINPMDADARADFIDELGDKWQEFDVYHHKYKQWMDEGSIPDPYDGATSDQIDWRAGVALQGTAQRWVDHAISKCVAAGSSLITTDFGILDVGEIANLPTEYGEDGFGVLNGLQVVNRDGRLTPATAAYRNGTTECLRVELNNGSELKATPEHKLLTLHADYTTFWAPIKDLKVGDYVVTSYGKNVWRKGHIKLADVVGSAFQYDRRRLKDITLPEEMTLELAEFLGYVLSDGHVSEHTVGLCQLPNNVVPRFHTLVESLFGLNVCKSLDKRSDTGLASYRISSTELADWMRWVGAGDNHSKIRVPKVIRCAGREHVRAFIRAITLDGHVTPSGGVVIMTSASKLFLQDLQTLLVNMGVESNIVDGSASCWTLTCLNKEEVSKFRNIIGFAEDRKTKTSKIRAKNTDRKNTLGLVPDYGLRLRFRGEILPKLRSKRLHNFYHSLTCKDKQGRELTKQSILEMADLGLEVPCILLDENVMLRRVVSVGGCGRLPTYDMSVPDTNSYVVNGIVSHNTCNLPADVSVDTVSDVYMSAWEAGCKGFTVYRDGCRSGVLVTEEAEKPAVFTPHEAPKRPESLPCRVHRATIKGEQWTILVGVLDGRPYEVFGGLTSNIEIPKRYREGVLVKLPRKSGKSVYDLILGEGDDELKVKNVAKQFENPEYAYVTRLISLSLRHGADIQFVVEQLQKEKDSDMFSFSKCLARVLKEYVADGVRVKQTCSHCGAEELVYQEGCLTCAACGWSKCS